MKKLTTLVALLVLAGSAFSQTINGSTTPFFRVPPPNWFGRWFDFQETPDYVTSSGNWTQAVTGTTPTATVTAGKGGTLVLAISSSANDKLTAIESKLNCVPASGDSFGFQVRFTTDTKVANANIWFGICDAMTNTLTSSTGYIANGVGLMSANGTLSLWTAKSAGQTSDMTTYSLGTLANSTTYNYTVIVRCDPTASGAGSIKVYRTTYGLTGAVGNALIKTATQSIDIPNGVSMGASFGQLATSTNSPGLTIDYLGWGCNR